MVGFHQILSIYNDPSFIGRNAPEKNKERRGRSLPKRRDVLSSKRHGAQSLIFTRVLLSLILQKRAQNVRP